ncbi:MAG: hypothetical protein K2I42_00895 [Anaeroplasmataceae bacterium]|nr:hypothetical protein [Anaeroplasmataceae bacterium]
MENKGLRKKIRIPFLLPIRCILFIVSFILLFIISKKQFTEISKWWTTVAIICNVITIIILFMFIKRKNMNYKELIHFEKRQTKVSTTILMICIIIVVGMVGLNLAGLICYKKFPYLDKTLVEPIPFWLSIIVLLLLPISTTIAEDGLYLGYAIHLSSKKQRFYSFLASVFYALQHSFIPFLPDAQFILYRFLSFLPLTVLICFWYQKKRDPLPFIIGHFLLNVATAVQILIMSVFPELYNVI